jgi:hypothetical protein
VDDERVVGGGVKVAGDRDRDDDGGANIKEDNVLSTVASFKDDDALVFIEEVEDMADGNDGREEDAVGADGGPILKPKKESRSSSALGCGFGTLPKDTGRLIDGGSGGGASGGGNFVGNGGDWIILDRASSCEPSLSCSSLALGTKSDKNSRSSEDRARERRRFDAAGLLRVNRPRKRDTADGAG